MLLDIIMCVPPSLSAKVLNSFAYDTVKERIPRILTKVIDVCHRHVGKYKEAHGEEGQTDAVGVISKLSQLRNAIMTDKPITELNDSLNDVETWNKRLEEYRAVNGCDPSWFSASWLYVECYMYRRIAGIFNNSKYLKCFDPFMEQKKVALEQSINAMHSLAVFLKRLLEGLDKNNENEMKQSFIDLMQVALWGNRCDLSISGGEENSQTLTNLHENLESFKQFMLVDQSASVWESLHKARRNNNKVRVDIVLDNSGFELYTDLVFADFLLSVKMADLIVLHPKPISWFVSDVTKNDFEWTISRLHSSEDPLLTTLAMKWKAYVEKKQMYLIDDPELLKFWCLPDAYFKMQEVSPQLYNNLAQSDFVFFKGDLNYRKLVGDLDWPHTTAFKPALQGFEPTSLCSLRTLKANIVVGLKSGQADDVEKEDKDWMITGKYAVVQSLII